MHSASTMRRVRTPRGARIFAPSSSTIIGYPHTARRRSFGLCLCPARPRSNAGLGLGKYQWSRVRDEAIELRYCEATDGGYWLTDWPGVLTPYSRKVICKGLRKREIPSALRWEVWERDDFRCRECGARRFLLGRSHQAGEQRRNHLPENSRTLCSVCSGRKGGPVMSFRATLLNSPLGRGLVGVRKSSKTRHSNGRLWSKCTK